MKPSRRSVLILLLSLFTLAPLRVVNAQASPPIERQWTVGGVTRRALIFLPPTATTVKAPVIFAFHGHGGSAAQASRSFRYQTAWPEAIVVYMQGLPTIGQLTDPDGTKAGWQSGIGVNGDRDLKFFDAVFASLKTDYKVDELRVFATGHSNGGGMTYLLWAARGDVFRAVAPCSAIPSRTERNLKPKPALHIAGQTDPLVKYAWQEMAVNLIKSRRLQCRRHALGHIGRPRRHDIRVTDRHTGRYPRSPWRTQIPAGSHRARGPVLQGE